MINFLFLVTLLIYLAASIFQTLSLAISSRTEAAVIRPTIERIAFWGTGIGFAFFSDTLYCVVVAAARAFPDDTLDRLHRFLRVGNHTDLSHHRTFDASPRTRQLCDARRVHCDTHLL